MVIYYRGFVCGQCPGFGVQIQDTNGKVLYHYSTENVFYNCIDLVNCIEEYLDHCCTAFNQYNNYVGLYISKYSIPMNAYNYTMNAAYPGRYGGRNVIILVQAVV